MRAARATRALQLETELHTYSQLRADRFVGRSWELDRASQHQYQTGYISDHKATRSAMGNMAKSLERDPRMESLSQTARPHSVSKWTLAADSARPSPSLMALIWEEAGDRDLRTVRCAAVSIRRRYDSRTLLCLAQGLS